MCQILPNIIKVSEHIRGRDSRKIYSEISLVKGIIDEVRYEISPQIDKILDNISSYGDNLKNPTNDFRNIYVNLESYDRAVMMRLAYGVFDDDWKSIIPIATAYELMDFSVITIDDYLDNNDRRSGFPTIHRKWGDSYSIILANLLQTEAINLLNDSKSNYPQEKSKNIINKFNELYKMMNVGQLMDVDGKNIFSENNPYYGKRLTSVSGCQISSCCEVGGILGGGSYKEIKALKDFGLYLGMIFQIRDDLIDFIDDEELIGKPPFSDFIEKKATLPMILLFKHFPTELEQIDGKGSLTREEKDTLLNLVSSTKIISDLNTEINGLQSKAEYSLEIIKNNSNKNSVHKLREILKLACSI